MLQDSPIANALVNSGALKFGEFKIKSGLTSPYYIDLTWLLSSPRDFGSVVTSLSGEVRTIRSSLKVDKLASIELKGALLLPSIANRLEMPCVIVRKATKQYGTLGRIAGGEVVPGDHVLFFDDVVSSGDSKLEGIRPLEQLGATVDMVMVVVDREQGGKENLEKFGYKFRALTTISEIISSLRRTQKITESQAKAVIDYVDSCQRNQSAKS